MGVRMKLKQICYIPYGEIDDADSMEVIMTRLSAKGFIIEKAKAGGYFILHEVKQW